MYKVTVRESWELTRFELVWSGRAEAGGNEQGCDSPRIHRSSVAGCKRSEHLLFLSPRRWSVSSPVRSVELMQWAAECHEISLRVRVKSVWTSRQISAAPRHSHTRQIAEKLGILFQIMWQEIGAIDSTCPMHGGIYSTCCAQRAGQKSDRCERDNTES